MRWFKKARNLFWSDLCQRTAEKYAQLGLSIIALKLCILIVYSKLVQETYVNFAQRFKYKLKIELCAQRVLKSQAKDSSLSAHRMAPYLENDRTERFKSPKTPSRLAQWQVVQKMAPKRSSQMPPWASRKTSQTLNWFLQIWTNQLLRGVKNAMSQMWRNKSSKWPRERLGQPRTCLRRQKREAGIKLKASLAIALSKRGIRRL